MKLTVFNGSGRGRQGNTAVLVDAYVRGFTSLEGNSAEVYTLMPGRDFERCTAAFAEAEHVLLAFPLYTDMVPGVVKAFLETLQPFCGRPGNPSITYLAQCGFPEGVQLRALEAYLAKLSRRLGCRHVGTLLRPNSEGIRETSGKNLSALLNKFEQFGRKLGETGQLDAEELAALPQPERLPGWVVALFKALNFTGLLDSGWNHELKKNHAYQDRFARPDIGDPEIGDQ